MRIEDRVLDLLSRMTLEEKIAQLGANPLDQCLENDRFSPAKFQETIESLGIGVLHNVTYASADGELGAVAQSAGRVRVDVVNEAQRFLVENTRLGIPAIITAEGIHGHMASGATVFPHSIAMASSWNPDLLQQAGAVVAREARAAGVTQILSPVLDLAREPRWGRVQETYGEDPYLVSRMGVAFITGLQGKDSHIDERHVAATPKHFVAHGSPEGGINLSPVHAGPRELRELYLPPFEAAVREAEAASIMPCYSELDGVPISRSRKMLTGILLDEWGFKGYTYSDWCAIDMLYDFHHTASDLLEAGRQAIEAGMDLEAPFPHAYGRQLLNLAEAGKLSEEIIDTAVSRILRVKFQLGLFENPYASEEDASKVRDCAEHRELARGIATESLVLLKNEGNILPFKRDLSSIAVIGPNADVAQTGNYSGYNDNLVTVLRGIRERVSPDTEVNYAPGCGIYELATDGIAEAVGVARRSDIAIVVVGESTKVCEEGVDQHDLELPGVQLDLVKAIHAAGTPVVAVLMNGRPLSVTWLAENVPAILEAWLPGEEGGNAIADVLFGEANPSGKLPVSMPRSVGHVPCFYNHKPSARGYYHQPGRPGNPGRDYAFSESTPLYEFGHGLSYTQFNYSGLSINPKEIAPNDEVRVAVTVENVGHRAGAEVVQLYVTDVASSVTTPVKALRRFQKMTLDAGESRTIEFTLGFPDLRLLNEQMEWVVEAGEFRISIGDLSDTFTVQETNKRLKIARIE